ncbi:MAG: GNAT family N-acetyltransferase [Firmicutes bacterium]|nr:GNAT family N-acetyltransferase [Bacillota bacterium]
MTDDDASVLWEIFQDPLFLRFLSELAEVFKSPDSIRTFVESFNIYQAEDTGFLFGVRLRYKLVGFIGIMDIPESATLFYAMHPDYRNMRIMSDAIDTVLSYWSLNFANIQLHTEVYRENQASLNILQHYKNIKVILK